MSDFGSADFGGADFGKAAFGGGDFGGDDFGSTESRSTGSITEHAEKFFGERSASLAPPIFGGVWIRAPLLTSRRNCSSADNGRSGFGASTTGN